MDEGLARIVKEPKVRIAPATGTQDEVEQIRWAEVPEQWRTLTFHLRDPVIAQHFTHFFGTAHWLRLEMPAAPELWRRQLMWWVFQRATGGQGREDATLLARAVSGIHLLAISAAESGEPVLPSLGDLDLVAWERMTREVFFRKNNRFPSPHYMANLRRYVRLIQALIAVTWSTRPWWEQDVWSPRLDRRIPVREHEPNGEISIRLDIVQQPWLREALRFWLSRSMETNTMVWSSVKQRLFNVGGVFGTFLLERGIDDPPLSPDGDFRDLLIDFSTWMRHTPSRRNGQDAPLRPVTRDHVRSCVQCFYTFMFDERVTAAKATGEPRWLDLTAGHTNLWRPQDSDRKHRGRAHTGRDRFIEPEDLRRMAVLIEVVGAPKGEPVTVTVDGQRRTFTGIGDEQVMRAWMIQALTGRRASEVLMMDFDPVEPLTGCTLDSVGEPDDIIARIRYQQTKIPGVDNTILVDRAVVRVVLEQQAWVRDYLGISQSDSPPKYLFIQMLRNYHGNRPRARSSYNHTLRVLDAATQLTDAQGRSIAFSESHRLRHSRATELLNAGAPIHVVQRYMGHHSPEMTMRYAQTLAKTAEEEFLRTIKIGRDGRQSAMSAKDIYDIAQLRRRTDRILPDGVCLLPPLKSCDKGNACKTCDHYVTDASHIDTLRQQLNETTALIEQRMQEFTQRHGQPMTPDNVWLEQRTEETRALERIIAALESDVAAPSAVRGAGVTGRAGYQFLPLTLIERPQTDGWKT